MNHPIKTSVIFLLGFITWMSGFAMGRHMMNQEWRDSERFNSSFIREQKENAIEVYELCRETFGASLEECRNAARTNYNPDLI